MALVKVGSKFRVFYEAKGFASGVPNIVATLRRPDGVKVGPLSLSEEILPEFLGTYSVDYTIPVNAPIGEWTGVIESPDENSRSAFRFSVTDQDSGVTQFGGSTEEEVEILIDTSIAELKIDSESDVNFLVSSSDVILKVEENQSIDLVVNEDDIILKTDIEEVKFSVDCEEI